MDADRVNRWLTLGANIGVLIGIILLIVEIDQNSELMQVQVEQDRSESYVEWQRQGALNDSLAALFAKLDSLGGATLETYEQLEPIERSRVRSMLAARFYDYENLYSQYERGFVSDEYWKERAIPGIRDLAPLWMEIWPPDGPGGRRAFKDEVERIFRQPE